MKEVVIIGGGASGLMASILIKRELGNLVNVTILERLEKTGKKLLSTGDGRCNFTNKNLNESYYNAPQFVKPLLEQFGYQETVAFFNELGILTYSDDQGRVFPSSDLSSSVLDVLRNEAKRLGIIERCNSEVRKIINNKERFLIDRLRGDRLDADYIVVATGGRSNQILGSNGSGYDLLKNLKVARTDIEPGLVGLKVDPQQIKTLEGIKTYVRAKLINRKTKDVEWSNSGELIFNTKGISGDIVHLVSLILARRSFDKKTPTLQLVVDFLPKYEEDEIIKLLEPRLNRLGEFGNEQLLIGLFHRYLGLAILKRTRFDVAGYIKDLTVKDLAKLATVIKNYELDIKGTYGFDQSHVTVGGIKIDEINPDTLETNKAKGVYVTGELIDVDGEIGGYNLQWAWTSAFIVSSNIVKQVKVDENE